MSLGAPPAPAGRQADRRTSAIALLLLAGAWLAFSFPALSGRVRFPVDFASPAPGEVARPPSNPELGDAFYVFYPVRDYAGDRLRDGRPPLWDPYRFAGLPFAADSVSAVWYPPTWLYALGEVTAVATVVALGSMAAALLLMYWFLRVIRLHPYAAAFGAVVFTFSAGVYRYSGNEAVLGSSIWLPLALGGLEVARRGRALLGATLAGAGLALSVLAGHAQIALYVWLAAGLWGALGVAATVWSRRREKTGAVAWAALCEGWPVLAAFALAAGLSAVQLLPTAQLSKEIIRQRTTFEVAFPFRLPLEHVPTLLVPDYQGNPMDGNYQGPGVNYTETALYAGVLTLPLALLGALRRPSRATIFFTGMTVLAALCVLGTPLYRLVLGLPGFSQTLFMTRFILLVDAGLAVLAALGLDALIKRTDRRSLTILGAGAGLVAAGLAVMLALRPGTDVAASFVTGRCLRALLIVAAGAALAVAVLRARRATGALAAGLVVLAAADLWLFGFRLNPFHARRPVFSKGAEIEAVAAAGDRPRYANLGDWWVPINGELTFRLYGISGYDPYVPRRMVELLSLAHDQRETARTNFLGPFVPGASGSPVFDLLGIGTVLGPPGGAPPGPGAGPVRASRAFTVAAREGSFPPAWVAPCWRLAADGAGLRALATMTSADLAGTAVVASTDRSERALASQGGPPGGCRAGAPAGVVSYEPERVVLRTGGAGGVLVLSDAWFAGWEVRVDGRRAEALLVDHALRGVVVPPGDHTVEWDYRPKAVRTGAAISGLTLAGVAVAWLAWAVRRRRRRSG